jgi:dipeptidyl aminopeptidase/acylaminoacyl peptidase
VFTALQRQGVPSELLFFSGENHWVLKPADSIQWYDTVLDWMNRWIRPADAPPAQRAGTREPAGS